MAECVRKVHVCSYLVHSSNGDGAYGYSTVGNHFPPVYLQVNAMNISFSICKQAQPLVSFPGGLNVGRVKFQHHEHKVVFVMGATGTGKSRLSIDLATRFPAEIVNSDKIQVYEGLDIVTNKVTGEECRGIPHHILGIVDPNADFTTTDFRNHASHAIESILEQDKIPIIAGGSNSFIESLVNDDAYFLSRYECCFLWIDVSFPILQSFVSERVDQMAKAGLVDEVRGIFDPNADYTRGIRRAIGVPEMDRFLRAEGNVNDETLAKLLGEAIEDIKHNTCNLAVRQLQKIIRLRDFRGWNLHHIDAAEAFTRRREEANDSWEKLVLGPSARIVSRFLCKGTSLETISPMPRSRTARAYGYLPPFVPGVARVAPLRAFHPLVPNRVAFGGRLGPTARGYLILNVFRPI